MSLVQAIINGTCPSCKTKLPALEREGIHGGWGVVDCPSENCNEWFDVQHYQQAGGKEV